MLSNFHYIDARSSVPRAREELARFASIDQSTAQPAQYAAPSRDRQWTANLREQPVPRGVRVSFFVLQLGSLPILGITLLLAAFVPKWIPMLVIAPLRYLAAVRLARRELTLANAALCCLFTPLLFFIFLTEIAPGSRPDMLAILIPLLAMDTLALACLGLPAGIRAWLPASGGLERWRDLVATFRSLWNREHKR